MDKRNFDINTLRVASPCHIGWENMSGNERIRHCDSCKMNVYNIAGMTKSEVEDLIVERDGRLCIRLYKRADGTVLTKDCPVGLHAYRKRIARFAGVTFAAILSLFSVSFGQKENKKAIDASKLTIVRTQNYQKESEFSGIVKDPGGAVVPGAEITLSKKGEKEIKVFSDENGNFLFSDLSEGNYSLKTVASGFKAYQIKNLKIKSREKMELNISLEVSSKLEVVGIYLDSNTIDPTSSSITTTITREMMEKIPH